MSTVRILYVSNLPASIESAGEAALSRIFSEPSAQYGGVEKLKRIKNYAFVHFYKREGAELAKTFMQGYIIDGTHIRVQWSKPPPGSATPLLASSPRFASSPQASQQQLMRGGALSMPSPRDTAQYGHTINPHNNNNNASSAASPSSYDRHYYRYPAEAAEAVASYAAGCAEALREPLQQIYEWHAATSLGLLPLGTPPPFLPAFLQGVYFGSPPMILPPEPTAGGAYGGGLVMRPAGGRLHGGGSQYGGVGGGGSLSVLHGESHGDSQHGGPQRNWAIINQSSEGGQHGRPVAGYGYVDVASMPMQIPMQMPMPADMHHAAGRAAAGSGGLNYQTSSSTAPSPRISEVDDADPHDGASFAAAQAVRAAAAATAAAATATAAAAAANALVRNSNKPRGVTAASASEKHAPAGTWDSGGRLSPWWEGEAGQIWV